MTTSMSRAPQALRSIKDVVLQLVVGAIMEGFQTVPGGSPPRTYGQVEAPQELHDVSTETQLELVDTVVGVVLVAILRLGGAHKVAGGDALALGPAHNLPLQQIRALQLALLGAGSAVHEP